MTSEEKRCIMPIITLIQEKNIWYAGRLKYVDEDQKTIIMAQRSALIDLMKSIKKIYNIDIPLHVTVKGGPK